MHLVDTGRYGDDRLLLLLVTLRSRQGAAQRPHHRRLPESTVTLRTLVVRSRGFAQQERSAFLPFWCAPPLASLMPKLPAARRRPVCNHIISCVRCPSWCTSHPAHVHHALAPLLASSRVASAADRVTLRAPAPCTSKRGSGALRGCFRAAAIRRSS